MSSHASTELVLSPSALRVGGAVAVILKDSAEIARYANKDVTNKDRRSIGDLVEAYPELNSTKAVGGLIWLLTFHGERIGLWVEEQISEYSLDELLLVLECLYDAGIRTGEGSFFAADNEESREYVPLLLELRRNYQEAKSGTEADIETVYQLNWLVEALGGLSTLGDYDSPARVAEALNDFRFRED